MKQKICLMVVATGKYTQFLERLLDSAHDNFLKDHDVTFNVFTDKVSDAFNILKDKDYKCIYNTVDHRPWPYATLYRFHFMDRYREQMAGYDYYFYIDVDTEIKAGVGNEILSERTGTRHCGFMMHRGSYESNPKSSSYVKPEEGEYYFGGGFWGFSNAEFWKFVTVAKEMVDKDTNRGVKPEHNDEAVLNRYFIDNPPTKVLNPSYHYPEGNIDYYRGRWPENYNCIILLLEKNHEEVRA